MVEFESSVDRTEFPKRQQEKLRYMDPEDIPSGTQVNAGHVVSLARSGSTILSIGCGRGEKEIEIAACVTESIGVLGIDINAGAIKLAQQAVNRGNVDFRVADVLDSENLLEVVSEHKTPSVVVASGLFCNLIGHDAASAMANINKILPRGGCLVVADCLHPYHQSARGLLADEFEGSRRNYGDWMEYWGIVYENNMKLFGPTERYTFFVVEKGMKDAEQYDADKLYEIFWQNKYERIARHWDWEVFKRLALLSGFVYNGGYQTIWRSRTGEPLLGFVSTFIRTFRNDTRDNLSPEILQYLALMQGYDAAITPR